MRYPVDTMMHEHNASTPAAAIVALVGAALLSAPANAQSTAGGDAGAWQYGASVYAWLPTLTSNIAVPITGSTVTMALDAGDIIDKLNMTFMGSLSAHNGRWGAFTDVVYMDIGDKASATREFTIGNIGLPAASSASINIDLEAVVWTLAGQYRLQSGPGFTMDVLAGARYLDIKQTVDWSITGDLGSIPVVARTGNQKLSGSNWDGIVGVRGAFSVGDSGRWSVPVYLDVGAGDSDLTWQGAVGVSYTFEWGQLTAMWRYLDYQLKGPNLTDMTTNGPLIGATLRW